MQVREAEEQCQARRGYAEGLCSREIDRSDLGRIPSHAGCLKPLSPQFHFSTPCLVIMNFILLPENASFSACLNACQFSSPTGPTHLLCKAFSKSYSLPLAPFGTHSGAPLFPHLTSGPYLALSNNASSLLSSLGVSLFPKAGAEWFEIFRLFPRSSRQVAAARGCCSGWPKSHPKRKTSKHPKRQSQMCPTGPASSYRRAHSPPREVVLDSWSNGWSKRKRKSQWPSGFRASNAGLSETKVTVCCTKYCCW